MTRRNTKARHDLASTTRNDEFSFDQFLVPEHDRYGKSLPVYFRIPPFLAHEAGYAWETGKFPFQTEEELSRWLFCVGLRVLRSAKEFDYSSPLLRLPLILHRRCAPIGIEDFCREVHKIVRDLSALGYRTPELHKFIGVMEDLVECLPSTYDRDEYLRAMEKFWPGVLESARWPAHPSRKGYRARRKRS